MSDRRSEAFERALDEAQGRVPDGGEPTLTQRPRMRGGVPLGSAPPSGGEARFGLALDWTDEPLDRPPPAPRERVRPPADTPAEIAADLGLGAALTLDKLTSRWRNFLWRNHPDRQPLEARESANARVALANMLYQRARRELGASKRQ